MAIHKSRRIVFFSVLMFILAASILPMAALASVYDRTVFHVIVDSNKPVTKYKVKMRPDFIVDNGWIYYRDGNDSMLYKVKLDGTSITKLTDEEVYLRGVNKGWVYYLKQNEYGYFVKMERMKTDGTQAESFGPDSITPDKLYFINNDVFIVGYDNICKVSNDSGQTTDMIVERLPVKDIVYSDKDWIYFTAGSLYRVKHNGSSLKKLTEDEVSSCIFYSGRFYYNKVRTSRTSPTVHMEIFKINSDGSGKLKLSTKTAVDITCITNNTIYFNAYKSAIYPRVGSIVINSEKYRVGTSGGKDVPTHEVVYIDDKKVKVYLEVETNSLIKYDKAKKVKSTLSKKPAEIRLSGTSLFFTEIPLYS